MSLVNLTKIEILSSGTGPLSLGPAVTGYRGTNALTDGATYSYTIQQGGDYETGNGTYLSSGPQLIRSPIESSYNGSPIPIIPGTAVSFTPLLADFAAGTVKSVASHTPDTNGNVPLAASDVGLGNVSNTSDANKPVSTATAAVLATKPDRYPANPYSSLAAIEASTFSDFLAAWWDTTNSRLRPTVGDGGFYNGLANPDQTQPPSSWQMWTGLNVVYEHWKLLGLLGDAAGATAVSAMLASQWTYYKTKFPLATIKATTGGIVNTSDDGSLLVRGLWQIYDATGATDARDCCVEAIPNLCARFHDPLQAQVDYGVTTPGGTAFKSDPFGMLYAAASDTASIATYGYISSSNEFTIGYVAQLLSQDAALSSALRTAFHNYAVQTYAWGAGYMLTPAPADVGHTVQNLVALGLNLDPNVNASNNTSVNGGSALTGYYQSNERYHVAVGAFYGKPLRGVTHVYLRGAMALAVLSALLGNTATATSIALAIPAPNGLGRTYAGVPVLVQARDPWSDGDETGMFVRTVLSLPACDPSDVLRAALVNTARSIVSQCHNGFAGANWSGRELNPITGNYTWEEENTDNYGGTNGGGQAKPEQIMTQSSSLSVVIGALQLGAAKIAVLGSGIAMPVSIEQMASELTSLKLAIGNLVSFMGGTFSGTIGLDQGFQLAKNASGNPRLNMDNNDLYQFDRSLDRHQFYTNSILELMIGGAGSGLFANGPVYISTAQGMGFFMFTDGGGNPQINWANNVITKYDHTAGKLIDYLGGVAQRSLDSSGNERLAGALTQNTTP